MRRHGEVLALDTNKSTMGKYHHEFGRLRSRPCDPDTLAWHMRELVGIIRHMCPIERSGLYFGNRNGLWGITRLDTEIIDTLGACPVPIRADVSIRVDGRCMGKERLIQPDPNAMGDLFAHITALWTDNRDIDEIAATGRDGPNETFGDPLAWLAIQHGLFEQTQVEQPRGRDVETVTQPSKSFEDVMDLRESPTGVRRRPKIDLAIGSKPFNCLEKKELSR